AALNCLVEEGLISRKKGSGTRVEAPRPPRIFDVSTSSIEDLTHFSLATNRTILSQTDIILDIALAARLEAQPGSHWHRITTLRVPPESPDRPISKTEIYLEASLATDLEDIDSFKGLFADLIYEKHGISVEAVQQVIRPALLDDETAQLLKTDRNTPGLEITRRYISHGQPVLFSFSVYPAGRFEYRITLHRNSGYGDRT
ncbi:MAG TPA: GntR family transcriptional regulator, partial [Thiolinea sp.]|nr:GntR family transcriptional regulator [Thiolinea sp.]